MTAGTEARLHRAALDLAPAPVTQIHRPRVRSWIVFALAVIVAFFGLIFSRTSLDRSAFVLESLERQIATEQARVGELRVEVARLQAPERIAMLAEEMGLVFPSSLIALEAPALERADLSPEYFWAQVRSAPTAHP